MRFDVVAQAASPICSAVDLPHRPHGVLGWIRPMLGELLPVGGGDPIPLLKPALLVGRRESSDIVLRFPNVSGTHCELCLVRGYWFVKDLGSSNGTKVNGFRVTEQRLDPGDILGVAKHDYEVNYEPSRLGATEPRAASDAMMDVFSRPLLDSAGLVSRRHGDSSRQRRHPH